MIERGFNVFLDLKFHDIPNTVAQACAAATRLGVWMLNVHAERRRAMLTAAREMRSTRRPQRDQRRAAAADRRDRADQPRRRRPARTGRDRQRRGAGGQAGANDQRVCGLDGVVCSAVEAPAMRAALRPAFKLVTPGIRPPVRDATTRRGSSRPRQRSPTAPTIS